MSNHFSKLSGIKRSTVYSSKRNMGFQSSEPAKEKEGKKGGSDPDSSGEVEFENLSVIEVKRCLDCPWMNKMGSSKYTCNLSIPEVEHHPIVLMSDNVTGETPEWCLLNSHAFAIKGRLFSDEEG